jgi:transcriptional regulator with XRE-family HTH domain
VIKLYTNNQLGQNLKQLLVERGMRASELAELASINGGQLSRILNGKSYPSIESLSRIADVLGVTPGMLLDGEMSESAEADEEPILDASLQVALRSFRKLSKDDKKQLAWIMKKFAFFLEERA